METQKVRVGKQTSGSSLSPLSLLAAPSSCARSSESTPPRRRSQPARRRRGGGHSRQIAISLAWGHAALWQAIGRCACSSWARRAPSASRFSASSRAVITPVRKSGDLGAVRARPRRVVLLFPCPAKRSFCFAHHHARLPFLPPHHFPRSERGERCSRGARGARARSGVRRGRRDARGAAFDWGRQGARVVRPGRVSSTPFKTLTAHFRFPLAPRPVPHSCALRCGRESARSPPLPPIRPRGQCAARPLDKRGCDALP